MESTNIGKKAIAVLISIQQITSILVEWFKLKKHTQET